jgi:hypothetical protein
VSADLWTLDWRRRVHDLYRAVRAEPVPSHAHDLWRDGRDTLLREHPATPLVPTDREGFTGLPVAPYDPAYRFEVEVSPGSPDLADRRTDHYEYRTGTDGLVSFRRIGSVHLVGVGSLDVWWLASYGGGLFLPIRDSLAGRTGGTFGGGRYVLDTVKGADLGGTATDRLVVDLNFAYSPSCAYDPAWACPLAPPGNVVEAAVPVGELAA